MSFRASRRLLAWFATGLALLGLAACSSTSGPTHPLVVSGHPDWPPVMFRDGNSIDGIGPALAKMICDDLDIPAEFVYAGQWDEVQAKARAGNVDMLVAAYKTTARLEYYDYTEAYVMDPLALFVRRGHEFTFAKYEDLLGKKGVGTVGDSYGQEFDNYINTRLDFKRVVTAKEALDLVASGQADYFVYSLYSGHEELKSEQREAQFAALPHFIAEEPFYFAISKKSPYRAYVPAINRLIDQYKADGTIDKLIAQYKARFHLNP